MAVWWRFGDGLKGEIGLRIIREGDLNKLKRSMQFECQYCGCVFEAERTEYEYEYSQREDCAWYRSVCPTCGKPIWKDA